MRQIKLIKPDTSICDQAGYNQGRLTWQLMQKRIKEKGTAKHRDILAMLIQLRNHKTINSGMFNARVKNLFKQVEEA